jgi:alkanesulfonate monooxygenase SsuD/methylene tetrahydromethanopterin reductase-like flavin-dependent oxidoreductase (luciferase family)
MQLGMHLPLMQFGAQPVSPGRVRRAVDAARECGFAGLSANDHFVFKTPWLDGPTALTSVIERSGDMTLATTLSLAVLRGPVGLAKMLAAIDILSEGRLIAALGPGSSERDYNAMGVPFQERWKRFDEAIALLRALLNGDPLPGDLRYYQVPSDLKLEPRPGPQRSIPLWIGSWGSKVGLARVARAADGWLASAYNTTPDRFSTARDQLARHLEDRGRDAHAFPNALATMWTWVTESRTDRDRVLGDVLAPLLNRDPRELADLVCVGPSEHCAELLSNYADAGCQRVYLWPLDDEQQQLELIASQIAPTIATR